MKLSFLRLAATLLAVAGVVGLAALSKLPYAPEPGERALIRLSWRARGERVEECRQPTEDELRGLPPHMRQREICEGRISPYELRVQIDDHLALADTIHGAGAREDRPLYVFREISVSPGTHRLDVRFRQLARDPERDPADRAVPPRMRLATPASLNPREVLLVTYDAEARKLITRRPNASR